MIRLDIVSIGTAIAKKGVALWQGFTQVSDEPGDVAPLGQGADVFQSLGITSLPYPEDENGRAEGMCVQGVAGRSNCFIGARDTRSSSIVGNAKPGDTIMHSTGPQQAAQVQCKEDKRQVILATKDGRNKGMAVLLDGDSGKLQFTIPGMHFEMNSNDGSFVLTNGKASIIVQGDTIALDGKVIVGGTKPHPANKFMVSPTVGPVLVPFAAGTTGQPAAAAKGLYPAL